MRSSRLRRNKWGLDDVEGIVHVGVLLERSSEDMLVLAVGGYRRSASEYRSDCLWRPSGRVLGQEASHEYLRIRNHTASDQLIRGLAQLKPTVILGG